MCDLDLLHRVFVSNVKISLRVFNVAIWRLFHKSVWTGNIFQLKNKYLRSAAFSSDGKISLRVFNVAIWRLFHKSVWTGNIFQLKNKYLRSAAFSSDGKYISNGRWFCELYFVVHLIPRSFMLGAFCVRVVETWPIELWWITVKLCAFMTLLENMLPHCPCH